MILFDIIYVGYELLQSAEATGTHMQIISDDQPLFLDAYTELITARQNYSNQVVQVKWNMNIQ